MDTGYSASETTDIGLRKDVQLQRPFGVLSILLIVLFASSLQASGQQAHSRSVQAISAIQAIQNDAGWSDLKPGLKVLKAETGSGIRLSLYRVDLTLLHLSVALHAGKTGERIGEFGRREGGVFAVNGGFFSEGSSGEVKAIGALSSAGEKAGSAWASRGGYLVLERDGIEMLPSHFGLPDTSGDYLQSMPLLIEPGQKWVMNTNQAITKRRMLLCKDPQIGNEVPQKNELLVLMVTGSGMSLFEAGWIFRPQEIGGLYGCDAAIALDGGGSVQSWVRDDPSHSFRGGTPIHNALVFKER